MDFFIQLKAKSHHNVDQSLKFDITDGFYENNDVFQNRNPLLKELLLRNDMVKFCIDPQNEFCRILHNNKDIGLIIKSKMFRKRVFYPSVVLAQDN